MTRAIIFDLGKNVKKIYFIVIPFVCLPLQ